MMNVLPASSARPFSLAAIGSTADVRGIAIDVEVSADAPAYSVYLLTGEGRQARRIALTTDERAARRLWGLLARSLHVPRFIAEIGGGFRALDTMFGPVIARPASARRGRRVAIRRRPLSRRAKAQTGPHAIHAGEREIICYE